ncbi:polysaccharide deacetylase family protein [Streptomyces sp. VRA16 Mangrove soil]|nr:polysaccharide deacetylase family protein [Streptomyces sp. VRA16 Mangrove soil]MBO1335076.1 polysaccharide deacetylase family protein [Streptomyces sp. VRA16 Mangrove soil]
MRAAVACVLAAALLTGCAQSVDPIERMGRKAAQKVRRHPAPPPAGAPAADAYRRWGLAAPLAPAPRPRRVVPPRAPGKVPPVIDRVPVRDKVVFLTYDDGAEQDPRFVDMVRDLRLPISMFLTDSVAGPGYDHFGQLRRAGAAVENHTLTHPFLPGLGYVGQHAEICGQQTRLASRFGAAPRLLRPPYGNYDADTLRAAADCGIDAIVLWRASMQIHDLRYADGDRLRAGDIILAHFRGPSDLKGTTLTDMTTRMLRRIQEQGFTVGRLEDYV